jgi:hypothetical protein
MEWMLTLLTTSAGSTFATTLAAIRRELPPKSETRDAYLLMGIYTMGLAAAFAIIMRDARPIYAGVVTVGATIAAQEWAYTISSPARESAQTEEDGDTYA